MTYRDRRAPLRARAEALLAAAGTRGDCKRLGAWLDGEGEPLRAPLLELARARGAALPEEALAWPGKRLLRLCRGASEAAQVRRNPIRRDEAFRCGHCGREVPAGGAQVRDHCPWCLRSRHVDRVPGDRAADCGGLMDPIGIELEGRAGAVIRYRCRACGGEHRNRAAAGSDPPDDPAALTRLSALGERWEDAPGASR